MLYSIVFGRFSRNDIFASQYAHQSCAPCESLKRRSKAGMCLDNLHAGLSNSERQPASVICERLGQGGPIKGFKQKIAGPCPLATHHGF